MAVNASPMYQKAEERYRCAATPQEKLDALQEMLRLVPKHKASEKVQQQIKERIKKTKELVGKAAKAGGGHQHDPMSVHRQGAGQVFLLGAPNVGKSSIVGALTKAKVEIAEFPFSTHAAIPGMAHHEDVPIQLVDAPPVMDGHPQPGMMNAIRKADIVLLVVDLAAIDLIDQFQQCVSLFAEHGMHPVSTAELDYGHDHEDGIMGMEEEEHEAMRLPKRVLVVANKMDAPDAMENFETFRELSESDLKMIPVSAQTGEGLPEMMAAIFEMLHVIRVYAKKPGKPADKEAPFVLPVGGTVEDMARLVHNDVADNLKHARIWGGSVHDGQQVTAHHVLTDKNVVELHI